MQIHASTNNYAETVFENFVDAIDAWGVPSRVRGDRGGENIDAAVLITMLRGEERASFMWGS